MGLVVRVVVGMGHRAAGRLNLELRDLHRVVDEFPGGMACDLDLSHVAVGIHDLGHGRGHAGLVGGLHRDHEPLAVGADRIDVIGDHADPLAEAGDQVVLDVDLRAVRILLQRGDHVVEHALVADDVVDERLGRAEGGLHVTLERCPAGHIARHQGRGRHPGGIREAEHSGGEVEPFGRIGIAARQRRRVDQGVVPHRVWPLVEDEHAAGTLDRVKALPAEDGDVVGPLPLLAGRVGLLIGRGELQRVNEPADWGGVGRHLATALFDDGLIGLDGGEAVLAALRQHREGLAHLHRIVANDEHLRRYCKGNPPLPARRIRPDVVRIWGQFVDGQLRRCVGHRHFGRLLFEQTAPDSVDDRLGVFFMAGGVDEQHGGQHASLDLDRRGGEFAPGHLLEILQREPEFGEPLLAVLRDLLAEVLHEGLHRGVGDQLAVRRLFEAILHAPEVGDADPGAGGGREDRLAVGKAGGGGHGRRNRHVQDHGDDAEAARPTANGDEGSWHETTPRWGLRHPHDRHDALNIVRGAGFSRLDQPSRPAKPHAPHTAREAAKTGGFSHALPHHGNAKVGSRRKRRSLRRLGSPGGKGDRRRMGCGHDGERGLFPPPTGRGRPGQRRGHGRHAKQQEQGGERVAPVPRSIASHDGSHHGRPAKDRRIGGEGWHDGRQRAGQPRPSWTCSNEIAAELLVAADDGGGRHGEESEPRCRDHRIPARVLRHEEVADCHGAERGRHGGRISPGSAHEVRIPSGRHLASRNLPAKKAGLRQPLRGDHGHHGDHHSRDDSGGDGGPRSGIAFGEPCDPHADCGEDQRPRQPRRQPRVQQIGARWRPQERADRGHRQQHAAPRSGRWPRCRSQRDHRQRGRGHEPRGGPSGVDPHKPEHDRRKPAQRARRCRHGVLTWVG